MNNRLPPIHADAELWIELMADGELTFDQRMVLIRHLDLHPELWRTCATKLMEHQSLNRRLSQVTAITCDATVSELVDDQIGAKQISPIKQPSRFRRPRSRMAMLAYALVPCLALIVGVLVTHVFERQRSTKLIGSVIQENLSLASTFERVAQAEMLAETSLRDVNQFGIYGDRPVMLEVEKSARRAVYCTDLKLPDFVVEALLLAGNGIEVKEYSPPVLTANFAVNQRPFYLLEITPPVEPVF